MERSEFKKRMQSLKSYREQNPDKGYWDWKAEQFQNGGENDNPPRMKEIVQYQDNARVGAATQVPEMPTNIMPVEDYLSAGVLDFAPIIGDAVEVANIAHDVKEGNYKDAAIGLGLLAIPGAIAGKIAKTIKSKYGKQGFIRSIYNNVSPGSYYNSYIPRGSKKTEIKNALKDYILGKGDKIDPKWIDWFKDEDVVGSFISKHTTDKEQVKDIISEARQEAWMNYLGIPHEDKYLINTGAIENGMPVYRSNVTAVPNQQLQEIANRTAGRQANKQFTIGDYINSTGGNVGVSYNDQENLRHVTVEDIWDLNPFKDANRARILPQFVRNMYAHVEVQPDGYKKWVWNSNAPKWLTELEPSKILRTPGPFLNRTNINAKKLTKEQQFKYKTRSKSEFVNDNVDIESNFWEFDNPEDYDIARKSATEKYSKLYDELLKNDPDRLKITIPKDDEELLNQYGLFVRYTDGGEVPPSDYRGSNEPVNVNPFTKKPLANGSITPVLDLEDASNFTPIGDILSIRDAYIAAKNKDLLGLGLAGLGFMPFIPTVNRKATQDLVDKAIRQSERSKQVVDDFYTQRNNVYESMIENEDAFRRAARADRQAGTDYVGTYGQAIRDYLRDPSQYNDDLPSMRFDRDLYGTNIKMQVDPSRPGYITVNPRYKDPDELDDNFKRINPGLVRHEMGHQTDLKAGLQYTDRLADPKKFVSDDRLKEMFPRSYNRFKSTVLNKGSEIKSYMNEFREFLMDQRQWEPKESVNTFRKKLDRYSKQFPTLRMIFDSYKSKSDFVKDYNMVPITSTAIDKTIV